MKGPMKPTAAVIALMTAAFMAGHITTASSQSGSHATLRKPPSAPTVKTPRRPSPGLQRKKGQCAPAYVRREGTSMDFGVSKGKSYQCVRRLVAHCGTSKLMKEPKIRKVGLYYEVSYWCMEGEKGDLSPW